MSDLTVDLPEETERRLRAEAQRRGISLVALAREALAEAAFRVARGDRGDRFGPGRFAHVSGSVDDFLREKQDERIREAERDR